MTQMVENRNIVKLSSRTNVLHAVSMISGPIMASVMIGFFNYNFIVFFIVVCLFISILPILFIKLTTIKNIDDDISNTEAKSFIQIKSWFFSRSIFKNNNTVFVIIFWFIFMLCIGIIGPLGIVMIENVLNLPLNYIGYIGVIGGVGNLLASVALLSKVKKLEPNKAVSIGLLLSAVGYFIIGYTPNIFVYFLGLLFVGMTAGICPFGFRTSLKVYTENTMLGRTFSLTRFIVLFARIAGLLLSGMLINIIYIRHIYFIVAGMLFLATVGTFFYYKKKPNSTLYKA